MTMTSPLNDGYIFDHESVGRYALCCQYCGGPIWPGGGVHTCAAFRQVTLPVEQQQACTHCYCRITSADTSGPAHRICCNCSNRQAMGWYG